MSVVAKKNESVTSFESRTQQNLIIYILSLDANLAHFLREMGKWGRKSSRTSIRGFVNDSDDKPEAALQR